MDKSAVEPILNWIEDTSKSDEGLRLFLNLSKEDKYLLLTELSKIRQEATGTFLNKIYIEEKDKDIRKRIRKTLFALKTSGIRVDEPQETGEPVLKKTVEEAREQKGFMSNYDDFNTRLVVAAFEARKNTFAFLHATTLLSEGLMELLSGPLDRQSLEEIIREYRQGEDRNMILVDIDPEYAVYLIEEGSIKSGKYKEDVRQIKRFISYTGGQVRKPDDLYNLATPDAANSLPIEKIFEHDIFEHFKIQWKNLEEDRKEFNGLGNSSIVLPPYMIEEKRQEFLKNLSERNEMKVKLQEIKRVLEDYAYMLYRLNEIPYYKGLIEYLNKPEASAEALLYFIKKSLVLHETKTKEGGVIVNPYG